MGRYVSGIVALAAAFGVYTYNSTHTNEKLILLGLNLIFGDDRDVLAARTWQVVAAVGVLWLLMDLRHLLTRRSKEDDQSES